MKARKGEVGPFPADVKPVRSGVYRTTFGCGVGYSYFSKPSGLWGHECSSADICIEVFNLWGSKGANQNKKWCGLAKESK